MSLRKRDFKIGVWHGKKEANEIRKEEQLQRDLFRKGLLRLYISRHKERNILVRLIAFEMPLYYPSTGKCVDLLGIDNNWQPYIIELKLEEGERMVDAIDKINKYQEDFDKVKNNVEKEVAEKYFMPNFKFSGKTKKIILAERRYYEKYECLKHNDINYFYLQDRTVKNISEPVSSEVIDIRKFKKILPKINK